jgi:hypothetical protein
VLGLLPAMPDPPAPPQGTPLNWLAWAYPVTTVLGAFAAMLVLWLGFLAVRVLLRWTKAL